MPDTQQYVDFWGRTPTSVTQIDAFRSDTDAVTVNAAIVDSTTLDGMTAKAMTQLQAAAEAAKDAGLARIDVTAAAGSGHKSHQSGTEWDIIGYNADGSIWSRDQRVAVAAGAQSAGANRFGLYESGRTLHFGYGPPGYATNVTWGAKNLTSGAASRLYSYAIEQKFSDAVMKGAPFLAFAALDSRPTVAAARATEIQAASIATLMADLPKGAFGEEKLVAAALTGNASLMKAAFDAFGQGVVSKVGFLGLPGAQKEIAGYFGKVVSDSPDTGRAVKAVFDGNPALWNAVPAMARPTLEHAFAALPAPDPVSVATGTVRPGIGVAVPGQTLGNVRDTIVGERGLVRKGSEGLAVLETQRFLNDAGITDRRGLPLKEDGIFGPKTRQAVASYQTMNGLRPDGIVGPRTYSQMLADTMPTPRLRETAMNALAEADGYRTMLKAQGMPEGIDLENAVTRAVYFSNNPDALDAVAQATAAYRGAAEQAGFSGKLLDTVVSDYAAWNSDQIVSGNQVAMHEGGFPVALPGSGDASLPIFGESPTGQTAFVSASGVSAPSAYAYGTLAFESFPTRSLSLTDSSVPNVIGWTPPTTYEADMLDLPPGIDQPGFYAAAPATLGSAIVGRDNLSVAEITRQRAEMAARSDSIGNSGVTGSGAQAAGLSGNYGELKGTGLSYSLNSYAGNAGEIANRGGGIENTGGNYGGGDYGGVGGNNAGETGQGSYGSGSIGNTGSNSGETGNSSGSRGGPEN